MKLTINIEMSLDEDENGFDLEDYKDLANEIVRGIDYELGIYNYNGKLNWSLDKDN